MISILPDGLAASRNSQDREETKPRISRIARTESNRSALSVKLTVQTALPVSLLIVFITGIGGSRSTSEQKSAAPSLRNAPSEVAGIRFPIVRDTWFSNAGDESKGNNGGASRMKLKSIQEMSLVDIDPSALKGRVVRRATLHLHLSGNEVLHRVTVSSFASEWVEGTGSGYEKQPGSSTFDFQRYPDAAWAYPGSDLTSVMLGQGGTIWHMAEASPPDEQRWQTIAVDPAVVAARVAGVSQGFLLFDDTGTEWTRDGEEFKLRHMPNRMLNSRESGVKTAPFFTIELGEKDQSPPLAPSGIESDIADLPTGEARVSWLTPADDGPAGTIGFQIEAEGMPIPRYLVPAAGKPGDRVKMILRDLGSKPGASISLSIRAVDGAGNVGPAASLVVKMSKQTDEPLAGKVLQPFAPDGPLPKIGSAEIAVIDALDKVEPVTGKMIPAQSDDYLLANHLWQAGSKQIRLHAGKNEFVSFQILVRGSVQNLEAGLVFDGGESAKPPLGSTQDWQAAFYRMRYIPSSGASMPDPLVPMGDGLSVPTIEDHVEGQKFGSLLCEIYVPHEAAAGSHRGILSLRAGTEELKLNLSLEVWDFTIPDFLSFIPEMNCYSLPGNERDYYRLAHLNRTVLNRVPYYQSGAEAAGCAPRWDGKTIDFSQWDQRFGPYFDGSAFSDLPRKGVPLECFYLPLNDNWPSTMEGNYNGSYWADEAFPARYQQAFVERLAPVRRALQFQ